MKAIRRRTTVLVVAAIAVVALGGTALAGHIGSNVKSFTGCLVAGDGVIIKVKEGNAPKSACSAGQTEAHLSGGDITKISVTGALSGGGDNGEVTIGLKPEFTLPSGCASGQVAKWNGSGWACAADNDTTYSAGTGLALSGTQFSVASDYRVKNTPDCASGQFATGFDSSGVIQCEAPAAAALPWVQGSSVDGGIPDDEAWHVFASVGTTPGTYLVIAKGTVTSTENADNFRGAECRIQHGGAEVDSIGVLTSDHLNSVPRTPFALTAIRTVASGAFDLVCRANEGADGVGLNAGRIVGLRIG